MGTRIEKKYCGYRETGEDQNGKIKWRGKEKKQGVREELLRTTNTKSYLRAHRETD